MSEILLAIIIVLLIVNVALQLLRKVQIDLSPVEKSQERTERIVREEIANNRTESATAAQQSRQELANTLTKVGDSLNKQLGTMRETVEQRLGALQDGNTKKLDEIRQESAASAQKTREEVGKTITDFTGWQQRQFSNVVEQLTKLTELGLRHQPEVA